MSRADTPSQSSEPKRIDCNSLAKWYNVLASLPEPPETFTVEDVADGLFRQAVSMHRDDWLDVVEVETVPNPDGQDSKRQRYRIAAAVFEAFSEFEPGLELPCGHSGFRNLNHRYTCQAEWCDCTFSRSVIEEVFNNQ